jgi:uncharacterized protein
MKKLVFAILVTTSMLSNQVSANCFTKVDESEVKQKIISMNDNYGDVPSTVNCKKPASKADKIICSSSTLLLMEELDRKAYVFGIENATKEEVNHKKTKATDWIKNVRNQCKDGICLCEAFKERIDADLGGTSPYEE